VAAKERVERLRKGEDVFVGFTKPPTAEDLARILREAGIDPVDCARVNELASVFAQESGDDERGWETLLKTISTEKERAERAVIRKLHRLLVRDGTRRQKLEKIGGGQK
jgi:hypothetical protein